MGGKMYLAEEGRKSVLSLPPLFFGGDTEVTRISSLHGKLVFSINLL